MGSVDSNQTAKEQSDLGLHCWSSASFGHVSVR